MTRLKKGLLSAWQQGKSDVLQGTSTRNIAGEVPDGTYHVL